MAMSLHGQTRTCLRPRTDSHALTHGERGVVVCGLCNALDPLRLLYSGARSIQGPFQRLPLVLVYFRGYASIGRLPVRLQASIPSAGLALTRGAFHPLNSHPCQAATTQYRMAVSNSASFSTWKTGPPRCRRTSRTLRSNTCGPKAPSSSQRREGKGSPTRCGFRASAAERFG